MEEIGGVLVEFWRSLEEYFGIFEVLRSTLCKSLVNCREFLNVRSTSDSLKESVDVFEEF